MKVYVDWDFKGSLTEEAEAFLKSVNVCETDNLFEHDCYPKLCEIMHIDYIVNVPDEIAQEGEEAIDDYIGDTYDFCHFGIVPVKENSNMRFTHTNVKTAWLAHRELVKVYQEMYFRKAVDPTDDYLIPQFIFMLDTITQLGLEICEYDAPPYGYDLDYLGEHPTHTSWVYRRTFEYLPKIKELQNTPEPLKQRFITANQILTLISENFNESF